MFSEDYAAWKQRFLVPQIYWTQVAKGAQTRGSVGSDVSGVMQLFAWDVTTGVLRQLTGRDDSVPYGTLSPDGCYVYYFQDTKGNEIGHYVRVPFEGGEPEHI